MVDETNKFRTFILMNKVKKFSKNSRSYRFLIFSFDDWSITDANLFIEVPTQSGMMIDDTIRLVCVYMFLLREIFS